MESDVSDFPGDSSKPEGSLGQNGDSASSGEEALRIPMTSSPSSMSLSSSTSMVGGGGAADMISPPTQGLIGLPGKSILGDYFQEKGTSRRPFLLPRISFPGRPILYNCPQSLTAESSQAKVAFMGAIGLWRVPEEEKQGKETELYKISKFVI